MFNALTEDTGVTYRVNVRCRPDRPRACGQDSKGATRRDDPVETEPKPQTWGGPSSVRSVPLEASR